MNCRATYEAVFEQEELGEVGCPVCGRPAEAHPSEDDSRCPCGAPQRALMARDLYRAYTVEELGRDGYPPVWHELLKHEVRERAGHRCVRCGHPYRSGEHGNGEWSRCDERCTHPVDPTLRVRVGDEWFSLAEFLLSCEQTSGVSVDWTQPAGFHAGPSGYGLRVEAQWRILTVHHLDGDKTNCRWFNLAALCQRCHLAIQGKVQMARVWPWEHTAWFRPYVAGYYAWACLGEDITREEAEAHLEELLALERVA